MNKVLNLVTTGRSIRSTANIKLRQPLSELIFISPLGQNELINKYEEVFKEELNVKKITLKESSEELVTYSIKPNFKVLAPKVKSAVKDITSHLEGLEPIAKGENIELNVNSTKFILTPEDLEYKINVHEGFTGEESEGYLLLFNSTITEDLKKEGYVRDIIRRVQTMRKELDLDYTQNIELTIDADAFGSNSINEFKDYISEETLATKLTLQKPKNGLIKEWEFDEYQVTIGIVPL